MDSLTQISLGAAVGEAVLGKKVGNKAPLWGAIAGTIPDLDVLFTPLFDPVTQLSIHRSLSHSFLFAFVIAPLLGYLAFKIHKRSGATYYDWTKLSFLGIFTHPLLDLFTGYGTQFFYPFSNLKIQFDTIFVIDPLYTLPLTLSLLVLMFMNRTSSVRRMVNYIGLGLSSAYLIFTVINKQHVNSIFKESFDKKEIAVIDYMSSPTPFNNVLWRGLFKTEEGYYEGFYSLFDDNKEIEFNHIPQNDSLLIGIEQNEVISKLKWFSSGFYSVTRKDTALYFNDLRFGSINAWEEKSDDFIFNFRLYQKEGKLTIDKRRPKVKISGTLLNSFYQRIIGIEG